MKKISKIIALLSVLIIAMLGFVACDSGKTPSSITLDKTIATMEVGDELTLSADKIGLFEELVWSSSDASVASVVGGKITALKVGDADITVSAGAVKASCKVTVVAATKIPELCVNLANIDIIEGAKVTAIASVVYDGKNVPDIAYEWSENSSGQKITLAANKEKVVVTGVACGTATINVKCNYRNILLSKDIAVNIKEDIAIEITNLTIGDSGYAVELSNSVPVGLEETYKNTFTPSVKVSVRGEHKTDAVYTLEVDEADANILSIANNTITALNKGTAIVNVVYISTNSVKFIQPLSVNVVLPQVTYATEFEISLYKDTNTIVAENLTGNVESVNVGEKALTFVQTGNSLALSGYKDLALGSHDIVISTDNQIYKAKLLALTLVINSKADLDLLGKASQIGTSKVWTGNFVLGADIEYNGVFATFCGQAQGGTWGGTTGFVGTIDGRGHTISGLKINEDYGGFIGTIGSSGVVKNIGFVDCEIGDASSRAGIVASFVYGSIENVFVSVKQVGAWNCGGAVYYTFPKATINNVVVMIEDSNKRENNFALTAFSFDTAVIDNCYSFGDLALYRTGGDPPAATIGAEKATLKKFNRIKDGQDANLDLSAWNSAIWNTSGGTPTFDSYKLWVSEKAETIAITNDTSIKVDENLIIKGNAGFVYSLKEVIEGITIDGNTVKIIGNFNQTFTVVATHALYSAIKVEKTFATIKQKVVIAKNQDVEFASPKITLENFATETVNNVFINDIAIVFTQKGKELSLTVPASLVLGDYVLRISSDTSDYVGNVSLVTKAITSIEDWASIVATIGEDNTLNGYYVLNANLDYAGKDIPSLKGGLFGAVTGFRGIFDGRNHSISGVQVKKANTGFFGTIGFDGIVKNVAFINAEMVAGTAQGGIICDILYGKVENVYLSYANNGSWWTGGIAYFVLDKGNISNSLVNVTAGVNSDFRGAVSVTATDASTQLNNCFSISALLPISYTGGDDKTAFEGTNTAKNFATMDALKAAKLDLSGWSDDIWTKTGGELAFKIAK